MGSSTVSAQKLANEANIQMNQETNQANRDIAAAQNAINYQMFNEQNNWNREQWELENAYNDPSAQMDRYMKAGVNPLWAISGGDPGNAQHLESAQAQPAVGATMQAPYVNPEYDPTRLTNIVAAARDTVNSLQGFQRLYLDAEDVDTRRAAQQSTEMLNRYDALMKRSLTEGYNINNAFNTDTFSTRVNQLVQNLHNSEQLFHNMQQEGKNSAATYDNIVATKELINAEVQNFKSQVDYRLQQVKISNRQLDISQQNADANSAQVALERDQFKFDRSKWEDQLKHWNNDEIFRWASTFGRRNTAKGYLDTSAKLPGTDIGIKAGGEYTGNDFTPNFEALSLANVYMYNNCKKNPTQQNLDAYQRFDNYIKAIIDDKINADQGLPSSTIPVGSASVQNPSAPWNQ